MVDHFFDSPPTGLLVGFFVLGVNLSSTRVLPESGESPLFSYEGVLHLKRRFVAGLADRIGSMSK